MPHGLDGPASEAELLEQLSARCESDSPPSKDEIDVSLEHGFATLMALEAQLQLITSEGAEGQPRIASASVGESLTAQIEHLKAALSELRARTGTGRAASLGVGFVLPSKR